MQAERVILVEPRGFCAGVEMAIKALALTVLRFGPPVYCVHHIVHNERVVRRFTALGVRFVEDPAEIPPGATALLSAHGSSPAARAEAAARGSVVIDTACPLVTKVHHELAGRVRAGYEVLYVGHPGHDEALGALGVAPAHTTLVHEPRVVADLPHSDRPVAVLAQTTLAVEEWEAVVTAARQRFGTVWTPRRDDICFATTNRQTALRTVATDVDAVIVVGSASSANTRALVGVARGAGARHVERVDAASELLSTRRFGTVAVTAGASAPEEAVAEVVRALRPSVIDRAAPVRERAYFPLPAPLRRLLAGDEIGDPLLRLEQHLSADELLRWVERAVSARVA
jgi:4-hydroxy-3-methylbut-2-enyl diphosphate reductase